MCAKTIEKREEDLREKKTHQGLVHSLHCVPFELSLQNRLLDFIGTSFGLCLIRERKRKRGREKKSKRERERE